MIVRIDKRTGEQTKMTLRRAWYILCKYYFSPYFVKDALKKGTLLVDYDATYQHEKFAGKFQLVK